MVDLLNSWITGIDDWVRWGSPKRHKIPRNGGSFCIFPPKHISLRTVGHLRGNMSL